MSNGNSPKCLEIRSKHRDKVAVHFRHGRSPSLPENAIKLHEQVDKTGALLSETDRTVLRLPKPVMEPFMAALKVLEGKKYMAVSLLGHYISDLRDRLNHPLDYLELPVPADDPLEIAAKKAVIQCVEALVGDFDSRWGDGESILLYWEGKRRQPPGVWQEQVIVTALDSCTKWLYRIGAHEHDKVWNIVSQRVAEIAAAKHRGREGDTTPSATPGFGPAFLRDLIS